MTDQTIVTELQSKSKVYAPTDMDGVTDIKYNVFYDLGGFNYFNGERNRRGYYLSVTPVTRAQERGYSTESFGLFKGTKYFLSPDELKRSSAKAEAEARKFISAELIDELTNHVKAAR